MFVVVGGRRLRVREAGEPTRPPLMLLHGAGASSMVWLGTMRRLATSFRVLAVDMPGHGRSEGPAPTTLLEWVEAVQGTVDALDLARFALLGHSLGGAVALSFAATYPDRLGALVLVTTGARIPVDPRFTQLLETNPRQALERLAHGGIAPSADSELARRSLDGLLATPIASTRADFAICQTIDLRDRLGRIRCPTLVLGGSEDRLVSPESSREISNGIVGAKLHVLAGCGHLPFQEQEEDFVRIVAAFLLAPQT